MTYLISIDAWAKEPTTQYKMVKGEQKEDYKFHRYQGGVVTCRELSDIEKAKEVARVLWSEHFQDCMKHIRIWEGENRTAPDFEFNGFKTAIK